MGSKAFGIGSEYHSEVARDCTAMKINAFQAAFSANLFGVRGGNLRGPGPR